jgi:hypothetical protein
MTATALTRADVRSAYRYLLRSIGIAFQEDRVTLSAARAEARRRFHEANETMDIGSPEAWEGFKEARDTGKFLRENLVQGIKDQETGAYRMTCSVVLLIVRSADTRGDGKRRQCDDQKSAANANARAEISAQDDTAIMKRKIIIDAKNFGNDRTTVES